MGGKTLATDHRKKKKRNRGHFTPHLLLMRLVAHEQQINDLLFQELHQCKLSNYIISTSGTAVGKCKIKQTHLARIPDII